MTKKRLPAIADRAVWEKATKGRAGMRWEIVVEKVRKDVGGIQEGIMSGEKLKRYKTEVEERIERRKG